MKKFTIQSSFANGVLDPRVAARLDIKQYYQGVEVGQNIRFLPQGGLARRGGLKYIDEVAGNGRLIPFIFNTDQKYICVFTNLLIEIYRVDTLALVDTVVTLYTLADIPEIDYAQSADTMILVHENYPPRKLVRGATDADFTIANVTITEYPQHDFNDASSPTPVSEVQVLDFDSAWEEGDTFKIALEGVETETISFLEDTSAGNIQDMIDRITDALTDLPNTGNDGISITHTGTDDVYTITLAGASANDWQLMSVRLIEYQGGSGGKAFFATTTNGTTRKEDAWSSTRGYPRTVTFFEGRLWFGGSRDLPNSLWGSRTNNLFNFDLGKSRADDAIDITLDTDQINKIQALFGGRNLQVFTVGGEHVFRKAPSDPITPENVSIQPQTQYGSKRIKPVSVGGTVLFVQRTGKAIREFVFNFDEEAYDSPSITVLSPSIVNDPVDIQAQKGFASDDASYVYITNSDGTVSMFNVDRANEVSAWSTWTTDGSFISCAVAIDEPFFLVKRTIDSVDRYYLEQVVEDNYLDSYVTTVSGTSATGLDHLDSEAIYVATDDYRVIKGLTVPAATDIEDCEDAWNESNDADATASADTTDYKVGTASAKFVVAGTATAGDILATEVISSVTLGGSLRFWIKSSVATSAGDLQILLDDTASCVSPVETLDVPALEAGIWKEVTVALLTTTAATISIGLKYTVDIGACSIWVDDVRMIDTPYTVTLPYSVTAGIAGLPYTPKIYTMPTVQDNGAGFDLSNELRITRCTLEVYETMQITVNGNKMVNHNTPQTGRFSATLMGWSKKPNIKIEQPDPFPMTLLAINLEVDG
jgi:hypothetical protein